MKKKNQEAVKILKKFAEIFCELICEKFRWKISETSVEVKSEKRVLSVQRKAKRRRKISC